MNIKDVLGPSQLMFIGAIIVAIGGFVVAIGGYWSARETQHFQQEVKIKNEKIEELNNYVVSTITGGDSYCYLAFASINDVTNEAVVLAVSQGKYPVYDAGFRVVDLEEFSNIPKDQFTFETIQKSEQNINIGNMSPSAAKVIGKFNLGSGDEKNYNVFISGRNGFFTELIRLRRIDGKWKMATKVMRTEGDKQSKLSESIDEKFPRTEDGNVKW